MGVVVIAFIAMFFGVDPRVILQEAGQIQAPSGQQQVVPVDPAQDKLKDFVSVVLADTEDTWGDIFQRGGARYERPKLVLFTGAVRSACGLAQAAVGPFYCAGDHKVYIDLDFYKMLEQRFGAPGEFAKAYVLAHEIGHHVQNLLGISGKVRAEMEHSGRERANQLSVRQELQADCYAGIWANHANRSRHILEAGDVEAGLNAAAAIGDDRLQMQARGYVAPESFTHGSLAQRVQWFRRGLEFGELSACDTFKTGHV
jgi:predicted metalloprotease